MKIGQAEIIEFLESSNKPYSLREISETMGEGVEMVCRALNKLIKFKEIQFIELDRNQATAYLNRKLFRRVKIYFNINLDSDKVLQDVLASLHSGSAE